MRGRSSRQPPAVRRRAKVRARGKAPVGMRSGGEAPTVFVMNKDAGIVGRGVRTGSSRRAPSDECRAAVPRTNSGGKSAYLLRTSWHGHSIPKSPASAAGELGIRRRMWLVELGVERETLPMTASVLGTVSRK